MHHNVSRLPVIRKEEDKKTRRSRAGRKVANASWSEANGKFYANYDNPDNDNPNDCFHKSSYDH